MASRELGRTGRCGSLLLLWLLPVSVMSRASAFYSWHMEFFCLHGFQAKRITKVSANVIWKKDFSLRSLEDYHRSLVPSSPRISVSSPAEGNAVGVTTGL